MEHELVIVPRAGANDDVALVVAWARDEGEQVREGEVLCELDFSKSIVEVLAPRDGFLFHIRNEGDEVAVGAPLAAIADQNERPELSAPTSREAVGIKVTVKARKLIDLHQLDLVAFQGIEIVKEKHVLARLDELGAVGGDESAAEGELHALTPIRRRAAQALTESKQTIPHSNLCRFVDAERVEQCVERAAEQHAMMLGVSNWLVWAVARRAREFTRANASWRPNGVFVHSRVNVGFALNQPNGDLVVPIVPDADEMEIDVLAGRIAGLQKKAVRHNLSPEDLTGGTITVTSLIGTGVHQVFPIIVPGQAMIVAIGDRCAMGGQATYNLTAAFDHRVLNGAEAAEFLSAVAADLEGEEAELSMADPNQTKDTVIRHLSDVLRLDEDEIANLRLEVGYKRLKKWTSARHAEIIVAIEDEFEIEIDERSIPKLIDVATIVAYVENAKR